MRVESRNRASGLNGLILTRRLAAFAVLALLVAAGCGETSIVSGPHGPIPISPCSAERGDAWLIYGDSVTAYGDRVTAYGDRVAWHPQGTEIYFSIRAPHAAIYAASTVGDALSTVARTGPVDEWEVGPSTTFTLSPSGAHLVYSTCAYRDRPEDPERAWPLDRDYSPELARVQTKGSYDIRLTDNRGIDDYPAWSPDGRRIAFVSSRAASGRSGPRLHLMAVDGSAVGPIYSAPGTIGPIVAQHPPRWSPDGQRLAFLRKEGPSRHAVFTIRAGGSELQRLTAAVSGPSWSPDGRRLAFARSDGEEIALFTIAADGTDAQRVTTIPRQHWIPRSGDSDPAAAWIKTVAWSPDGSKILYTCGGVCVVELDGTPMSERPLPGDAAAWSPDGSRIATVSTAPEDPNRRNSEVLRTMAPDGSELKVLVRLGSEGHPIPMSSD